MNRPYKSLDEIFLENDVMLYVLCWQIELKLAQMRAPLSATNYLTRDEKNLIRKCFDTFEELKEDRLNYIEGNPIMRGTVFEGRVQDFLDFIRRSEFALSFMFCSARQVAGSLLEQFIDQGASRNKLEKEFLEQDSDENKTFRVQAKRVINAELEVKAPNKKKAEQIAERQIRLGWLDEAQIFERTDKRKIKIIDSHEVVHG